MKRNGHRSLARHVLLLAAIAINLNIAGWAAPVAEPCSAGSETRQLDYWLGTWTVTYPSAPGSSTSTVSLSLDKCLFVENWNSGKGHAGENLFAYSPEDKSWHGMFADNQGRVHIFVDGKV